MPVSSSSCSETSTKRIGSSFPLDPTSVTERGTVEPGLPSVPIPFAQAFGTLESGLQQSRKTRSRNHGTRQLQVISSNQLVKCRSAIGEAFVLHWLATARPSWAVPGQKGAIPLTRRQQGQVEATEWRSSITYPQRESSAKPSTLWHATRLLKSLHKLLCLCWEQGHLPQNTRDANIVTLHKGDRKTVTTTPASLC